MPGCQETATDALCASHIVHLSNMRIRADVFRMLADKPSGQCLRCNLAGQPYAHGSYCAQHIPDWPDQYPVERTRPPLKPIEAALSPEPILTSRPIAVDDARMPSGVKRAVKWAIKNDWRYSTTVAIGPEPDCIQSVVMRCNRAGVRLASRHEKNGERPMGFKVGWIRYGTSVPHRAGWRDLMAQLQGIDLREQQISEVRRATLWVMDTLDAELLEVI